MTIFFYAGATASFTTVFTSQIWRKFSNLFALITFGTDAISSSFWSNVLIISPSSIVFRCARFTSISFFGKISYRFTFSTLSTNLSFLA